MHIAIEYLSRWGHKRFMQLGKSYRILFSRRLWPVRLLSVNVLLAAGLLAAGNVARAASEIQLPQPLRSDPMATLAKPDPRVRQYILPQRIVWVSSNELSRVEQPEHLLRAGSGQVTLDNPAACTMRHQGKAPSVLLDFGRELHGGVQIMVSGTHDGKPVMFRVRFGESVSEALNELGGDKNTTNDHAVRDQTCLVPWLGTHEIGNTGFRFVRLDLLSTNAWVQVKAVRAVFLYRDLPYLGQFRCSDERLNKIWEVGAYTVHLNMQDYVWDGIKRDRLVWIGDMHPETMTISTVFGQHEIVPASLDLIRNETPLPKWMNGISSYSMWWILIHRAWYQHGGDLEYLRQQSGYLTNLLMQLTRHIGSDHRETLPEMRFLDWPSSANKPAIHAGLHSLMVLTFKAGAELCAALGDSAMRQQCETTVARLRQHTPGHGNSKQAAALMALAGLADPAKMNNEVLAVDGAKRMSTFYGYYVIQARALAGDYQGALDCIRTYWGTMIDFGATTFWEDFDLDWVAHAGPIDKIPTSIQTDLHGDFGNYCYKGFRHSLCHGWASGPTPWLSEHVLGIQVLEPGAKTVRIQPHLADLQWAEGAFPTPLGVIKVRHDKQPDGSIKSKIDAPAGVRVVRD